MKRKYSISEHSVLTLLTRILTVALNSAIVVIVARRLGVTGNGIYSFIILVNTVMTMLFSFGLSASYTYLAGNRKLNTGKIISSLLSSSLLFGLTAVVLYCAAVFLFKNSVFRDIRTGYLLFGMAAVPASLLAHYSLGIFVGKNRIRQFNTILLLPFLVTFLLLLPSFVFFPLNVPYALGAWLAGILAAGAVSLRLLGDLGRLKTGFDKNVFRESMAFGIKSYLANVISLLNFRLVVFVVKIYSGNAQVGFYLLAVLVAEILWYIPSAMATSSASRVASSPAGASVALVVKGIRHTLFLTGILFLLLFFAAPPVFLFIVGEKYLPALAPMRILLPGVYVYGIATILSNYFSLKLGRPLITSFIAGVSMTLNLVLGLVFIPRWGLSGAAFATSVSYCSAITVGLALFLRMTKTAAADLIRFQKSDFKEYRSLAIRLWRTAGSLLK